MDTLYRLLEWNPVQVGSTFQGGVCIEKINSKGAGGGGERVTRAYTVEVQTASVFYAQSLILLLFEP